MNTAKFEEIKINVKKAKSNEVTIGRKEGDRDDEHKGHE
jgi:hypothetical protein